MRSSESYRLVNNFEKKKESRHLLRCRLSKRTAERWAIWEIWSRVPFISSALWTHWHKSCLLCSGKPGATWRTQGMWCQALCWLEGWRRAINTRDQRPGVILGGLGVPLAHWHMCWAVKQQQAKPHGCCIPAAGGCSKAHPQTGKCPTNLRSPAPYTEHPLFPLHFLGVRKSYVTRSGVCFQRAKPPLTRRGQGRPREDQRVTWSGR